jgi:hypothetical protein
MRSRLVLLGLALVLVLAGCTGGSPVGSSPTETMNETSTPTATTTPAGDSPLTPKPLPERPETLTQESVVEFAKSYEQAYKWNQELTNNTLNMTINPVRSNVLNTTETGYVVHLEVGFSQTLRSDGDQMAGGGFYTANYFINETTIMRAEAGGQQRPGPNPRNGTDVEE